MKIKKKIEKYELILPWNCTFSTPFPVAASSAALPLRREGSVGDGSAGRVQGRKAAGGQLHGYTKQTEIDINFFTASI